MNNTELIKDTEERIKLFLTISIFFPSLLASFIKADSSAKAVLPWSLLVGFSLLSFIFFQFLKKEKVSEKSLKWLNGITLVNLCLFIFPTLYLATEDGSKIVNSLGDKINLYTLIISLRGLPIMSFALLVTISLLLTFHKNPFYSPKNQE